MLNPYRRTVCLKGSLGACLVTGTEKIRSGYGNGDCLLLDFRHRLFAVADASERFPHASHQLVAQLIGALLESGPPETEPEFNALLEGVWSRQPFTHKSTLSCVRLMGSPGSPMALTAGATDDTAGEILIMGGTQPAVETAFRRLDGQATTLDRWRPIRAWKPYPDLLATAGIRIV